MIFALKSKKERGVSASAIAGAVLAAFAALVLLVLAAARLSAADDTFSELIDDLRLTLTLDLDETWFYRLLASLPVGAYVFGLLAGLSRRTPEDMRGRGAAVVSRLPKLRTVPAGIWAAALGLFSALYLVFFFVQGRYLFGAFARTLPGSFTVAEYARQELLRKLCRVMAIASPFSGSSRVPRAAGQKADPLDGRRPSGPEHAVRRHRDLQAGAVYRLLRPHAPARAGTSARMRAAPRLPSARSIPT